MVNVYEAESQNKVKSAVIVAIFLVFVFFVVYILGNAFSYYLGYAPGGLGYIGLALIVSGIMSFGGYYFSDKIVLATAHARPANRKRDFLFYTVAENLAIGSGLPKPALYVIDDPSPNAFATGRDPKHAVLCATTGLLSKLNRTELEGIIAHELTHVKNYDTRLQSVVAVLVGMVALLGDWFMRSMWWGRSRSRDEEGSIGAIFILLGIIFAIASPIVAQLIQLAITRRREFTADAGSVLITRQPSGLISALKKISADTEALHSANKATAHLFIVNPFRGGRHGSVGWLANLFNTHPPVAERIKALEDLA